MKFFSYGLLLEVILVVLSFVLALLAISLFYSAISANPEGAIGSLIALAGAAMLTGLLALIAFILFIIGLIKFYQGKDEFGPAHAKNFQMAIIFLILGIVLPIVGGAFSPGIPLGSTNVEDYYAAMRVSLIASGVMGLVGTIFMTMCLIYLVKALAQEELSKLKLGQILVIIGPIIGIVAVVALTMQTPKDIKVQDLWTMYSAISMVPSAGSIVGCIGYFFFYQAYKSIHNKMSTGRIMPMPRGAPPYGAPGYPAPPTYQAPPPPPPPGVQYQPQYQPPGAPPPLQPRQP